MSVVGVEPSRGSFTVRVDAFEDQGARWELGLEEIDRFQFPAAAASASAAAVSDLEAARDHFDQALAIGADPVLAEATSQRIDDEQSRAVAAITARRSLKHVDIEAHISQRRGSPHLTAALESFLADRGLLELDRAFARSFVSNPRAGELVKGHALVLAELGLCPYKGKIPRDPTLLAEPWSRELRARHLIARIAFSRATWTAIEIDTVTLYRAAATDGRLTLDEPTSFVSATFSRDIAEAHFAGGPSTAVAVMWRQAVSIGRLLMTFLETAGLNERFLEAEAILIGDPANSAF